MKRIVIIIICLVALLNSNTQAQIDLEVGLTNVGINTYDSNKTETYFGVSINNFHLDMSGKTVLGEGVREKYVRGMELSTKVSWFLMNVGYNINLINSHGKFKTYLCPKIGLLWKENITQTLNTFRQVYVCNNQRRLFNYGIDVVVVAQRFILRIGYGSMVDGSVSIGWRIHR